MCPDDYIIFLHQLCCLNCNFSSARNHPRHYSNSIWKYYRTLCCRFPEFSGKYFIIQWKYKCQSNRVRRVCMINNTMLSICQFLLNFMIHQVRWKLTGRSSTFYQSPADTIIHTFVIQFDDCQTYFRVNNNISEIFAASCHKEKFSCQPRYFCSDRCPFSWRIQTRTNHLHFFCFQTIT